LDLDEGEDDDDKMESYSEAEDSDKDKDKNDKKELMSDEEEKTEASMKRENSELKKEAIALRNENRRLKRAVSVMKEAVSEVNLFNARLAGTQQLARKFKLSESQIKRVIVRFDECDSINEVKKMYKALNEGYSSVQRKIRRFKINKPNTQSVSSRSINENTTYKRMQQLAGV